VFLAHSKSTLSKRDPRRFGAMDRKFGSVSLPSDVHGLAPVSLTSNQEMCSRNGRPHGGRKHRVTLVGHAALVTARHFT